MIKEKNEEKNNSIIIALKWLFKKLLLVLLILIMGILIKEYYSEYQRSKLKDEIKVVVEFPSKKCENKYPIYIQITNTSDKTIDKSSIYIGVYNKGYSTNLAINNNQITSDKIIKPNEVYDFCHKKIVNEMYVEYVTVDNKAEKLILPNDVEIKILEKYFDLK